jgi:3-deoxy-manno-octulosonate cytidylyltransferase (CMP-KDO synthetase)
LGAEVVLTPERCATGSDRTAAALHALGPGWDAALNLQGDAVLTPPWALEALAQALRGGAGLVTAAVKLDAERYQEFLRFKREHPTSGTTVTIDQAGNALYFSKAVIPALRNSAANPLPPIFRHIGIYGYSAEVLARFAALPASSLEMAEGLEQLRALEHGLPIRVVEVDYRGRTHWSVDGPGDIAQVEAIIAREGELVP